MRGMFRSLLAALHRPRSARANLLAALLLCSAALLGLGADAPATVLRLRVSLSEGSRLFGTTSLPALTLRSDTLGLLRVPLGQVWDLRRNPDGLVQLRLRGGDRLQGRLQLESLPMHTLCGELRIPTAAIRDASICAPLVRVLRWNAAPAGPGARLPTSVAALASNEVRIAGQPIIAAPTFTVPAVMTGEVRLEARQAARGELCLELIAPADLATPTAANHIAVRIGYGERAAADGGGVTLLHPDPHSGGTPILDAVAAPLPNAQWLPLRVELYDTTVTIKLAGKEFIVEKVSIPFTEFCIRFSSLPATNTWHVRNLQVE